MSYRGGESGKYVCVCSGGGDPITLGCPWARHLINSCGEPKLPDDMCECAGASGWKDQMWKLEKKRKSLFGCGQRRFQTIRALDTMQLPAGQITTLFWAPESSSEVMITLMLRFKRVFSDSQHHLTATCWASMLWFGGAGEESNITILSPHYYSTHCVSSPVWDLNYCGTLVLCWQGGSPPDDWEEHIRHLHLFFWSRQSNTIMQKHTHAGFLSGSQIMRQTAQKHWCSVEWF